jgi:hypothetical protein
MKHKIPAVLTEKKTDPPCPGYSIPSLPGGDFLFSQNRESVKKVYML